MSVDTERRERASAQVTIYAPDNSLRRGYRSLVADVASELVQTRWLTWQLLRRDVSSFYKQSLLGALWLVIVPLVTVATFIGLRSSGVVKVGAIGAPYPVFAVLGVAVWQLFAQGIVSGAGALVASGDMISRINFSKKALVIAAMGRTLVSFGVLGVLTAVLMLGYALSGWRYSPAASALLAPISLVPTMLLTLGLGFQLALLNALARDVATLVSMLVTFLMLLTPVLYERPIVGKRADLVARLLDTATEYNPLYYLVEAPRELVLSGRLSEPTGFWLSSLLSLAVFLVSLVGFHLTESRVAERI